MQLIIGNYPIMLIKQDELVNTLSTLYYTYIKYPLGGTFYTDNIQARGFPGPDPGKTV
jgi:hypothetical protein